MAADEKIRAVREATNLDDLRLALIEAQEDGEAMGAIGAQALPSFGGLKPRMLGVLSYDPSRLLMPDADSGDLCIITRKEAAALEARRQGG
jgi:hypothetical protein